MTEPIGASANMNFLACLVLFLAYRPKFRVLLAATAAAACLGAYLGFSGNLWHRVLEALSYCGAGAIPAVFVMPFLTGRSDLKLLAKLSFPPVFGILTALFLNSGSHGVTYDHYLYAFDGSLGFQPSFWAGRLVAVTPAVSDFSRTLYEALPVFLMTAYVIAERQSSAKALRLFVFIVLVGVCGAACYVVFPAVGAYWLFARSFPWHPPALNAVPVAPTYIAAAVARNCMPSLHTAWALVVFWAAGKCSRPWRTALRALLAIMLLQTLVFHYLADMIVAVPFTLALYAITQGEVPWSAPERRAAAGFGFLAVAVWLVALRWGTGLFLTSLIVPWAATLLTVIPGVGLWRRLDRAASNPVKDPARQARTVAAGAESLGYSLSQ